MNAILSCAGRLILNNTKCLTLPRQISCCFVAATYYEELFRKVSKVALWEVSWSKGTVTNSSFASLTAVTGQHSDK